MNVFFDESGQTGCVIKKDDLLNFRDNPTFAIAAIVVNKEEQKKLTDDYLKFKRKFNIQGEIKGTDLLTRGNNDKLNYFIDNILRKCNVYINIYDKRFYLSTLILFSLCGIECLKDFKYDIYHQASILSLQDDNFFVEYLNFIENKSDISIKKYLNFLINYDYKYFKNIDNLIVVFAKEILEKNIEKEFIDDFMSYGWYSNPKITNLINLNCLTELLYLIKKNIKKKNNEIVFIHDRILEFENVINDELSQYDINVEFGDSKDYILLQIVDNVVSIFRHLYDKSLKLCKNKNLWIENFKWDLEMFATLHQKILINNIKYTVPLPDWAACLSIKDIFSNESTNFMRNNYYFNLYYSSYFEKINDELINNHMTLKDVNDVLKD